MESIKKRDLLFINAARGTIKEIETRTGKSIKSLDKKRNALPPGKRISKSGKVYYEKRRNRSDLSGTKV
jgi:hypothetical protein